MFEIDTDIGTRGHTPESVLQLSVMYPDFNVLAVHKFVQSSRMVQVKVTNDDLLDVLNLVSCGFDGSS